MKTLPIAELHFVEVKPDTFEAVIVRENGTRETTGEYVNLFQASYSPYVIKPTGEMVEPMIPIRILYLSDEKTKQTPCKGEKQNRPHVKGVMA